MKFALSLIIMLFLPWIGWTKTTDSQDDIIWKILLEKTSHDGHKGVRDHLKRMEDGSIQYVEKADRDRNKQQKKSVSKDINLKMLSWHLSLDDRSQDVLVDDRLKRLNEQAPSHFNQLKVFADLYIFTGISPVSSLRPLIELCEVLLGREFKPADVKERCDITKKHENGVEATSPYMLVSDGIAVIGRNPVRPVPGVILGQEGYCSINIDDVRHRLAYLLYFEVLTQQGWTKVAVVSGHDHTNMTLTGYYLEEYWIQCLTHFLVDDLKSMSPAGEPVAVIVRSLNRERYESQFQFWLEAPELSVADKKKDFDPQKNKLALHLATDFTLKQNKRQLTRVYYYRQGKFRPLQGSQKVFSVPSGYNMASNNGSLNSGVAEYAESEGREVSPFAINYSILRIPEKQTFREVSQGRKKVKKGSKQEDEKLHIYLPLVNDY